MIYLYLIDCFLPQFKPTTCEVKAHKGDMIKVHYRVSLLDHVSRKKSDSSPSFSGNDVLSQSMAVLLLLFNLVLLSGRENLPMELYLIRALKGMNRSSLS